MAILYIQVSYVSRQGVDAGAAAAEGAAVVDKDDAVAKQVEEVRLGGEAGEIKITFREITGKIKSRHAITLW